MRRNARGHNRGGPGLLRTVGRTAVVAGTATAVSKGVSGAMDSAAQQQAIAAQQQAAAEQQRFEAAVAQAVEQHLPPAEAPAAPAAPAAPGISPAERIAMLQQLAELKGQGILSDAEFEAEKARILAS